MLELRPTCEHCNVALDPLADDARICTYECTVCAKCATWVLLGICPNCTGELVTRPRRPASGLAKHPRSSGGAQAGGPRRALVEQRLHDGDLPAQVWTVSFANGRPADSAGDGYSETANEMDALASAQPGFLGVDAVRSDGGEGITVSRWASIAAMVAWRRVVAHQAAQNSGRDRWYEWYRVYVARVEEPSAPLFIAVDLYLSR
jgi:uncharacterized protein